MTAKDKETIYSLEGKGFKFDSAKDIESQINDIQKLENIVEIKLSGNTFGVEASVELSKVLAKIDTLRILNLSDIFTGRLRSEIPLALKAIGDAIMDKQHLHELDLSDNAFGPAGAEPLSLFLKQNRSLKTLKLNNNGLGPEGGRMIAQSLLDAQEINEKEGKSSNLHTIVIGRNRLENKGAELLAAALKAHKTLKQVRLPQNGIRPEGIKMLAEGLSHCSGLEILDLQDNTFTEQGSVSIAAALPKWKNLKVLNIGDCLLGAKGNKYHCYYHHVAGSIEILKSLQQCTPPLEVLNLQYSEMNDHGALLTAALITKLENIQQIWLNGNCFNPDGNAANAIKSNLERKNQIEALDEWDDMEYDEDEDDDIDYAEETAAPKVSASSEELSQAIEKLSV